MNKPDGEIPCDGYDERTAGISGLHGVRLLSAEEDVRGCYGFVT